MGIAKLKLLVAAVLVGMAAGVVNDPVASHSFRKSQKPEGVNSVEFQVVEDDQAVKLTNPPLLKASAAVRLHDLEFRAVAEPRCAAPAAEGERRIYIGLSVTNRSDKLLVFDFSNT